MEYIRRRILTYIAVFLVALNVDFALPRIAPGNASQIITAGGSAEQGLQIALRAQKFGLSQPIYVQYYQYLQSIFATWPPNLGVSYFYYPQTVMSIFLGRIGWTMLLILSSLFLSFIIAYAMAAVSSQKRGGKFETAAEYGSIALQATPVYWVAMILLWVFAVDFAVFPYFGSVDIKVGPGFAYVGSVIWHSVLPVAAMTASILGENYLILRGSVQDVLKSDYVLLAKTRGIRDRVISTGYILRNSLLPLVSLLTFSLASLISRVILVEAVFGYSGVGDMIIDAIVERDYPVLEGTLLLLTVIVIVGGLIGDLILVRLNPKLRR